MSIIHSFIVPHPPLIIPEIGKGKEKEIQSTINAYHEIATEIADIKPDTIILTSPHAVYHPESIHISPGEHAFGDFTQFGFPKTKMNVKYDSDFSSALKILAESKGISVDLEKEEYPGLDHGTMVPLHFINQYYTNYKLVRISISSLPFEEHYALGSCVAEITKKLNKNVVFLASGDLSHVLNDSGPYGYKNEGPLFDKKVIEIIKSGEIHKFLDFDDYFCNRAAECGLRGFIMMAGCLQQQKLSSRLLSYEGPFGVGYAIASFKPETDPIEDKYVSLAKKSLEYFVNHKKKLPLPQNLNDELLHTRAGVFVSLKVKGNLRGCIGTLSPATDSLASEIIQNAISAGMEDPRFYPVTKKELSQIDYSVDVLLPFEKVNSKDELDPLKYGVVVTKDRRRGLLLPNLDGVNTVDEQLDIALQKAGILPHESYQIEKFEVIRHQ